MPFIFDPQVTNNEIFKNLNQNILKAAQKMENANLDVPEKNSDSLKNLTNVAKELYSHGLTSVRMWVYDESSNEHFTIEVNINPKNMSVGL